MFETFLSIIGLFVEAFFVGVLTLILVAFGKKFLEILAGIIK